MKLNATVYFDDTSNPANPGWVCETDEDGRPSYQLELTSPGASDAELIADARSYAEGEISIRR